MKTIGLLGGMSWESTANYYKAINEEVKKRLGGFHSAKVSLYSVDFAEIEQCQKENRWDDTLSILIPAAQATEMAGADVLLICTNTMHKVAQQIENALSIPLLHIADATAEKLLADQKQKVGLLGTRFTMEQDFYKGRLKDQFKIDVVTPNVQQREQVHRIIYEELCMCNIVPESKSIYLDIIQDLKNQGAEAVILGCTEIAMLVQPEDTDVPLYDTTLIHAQKAVDFALE